MRPRTNTRLPWPAGGGCLGLGRRNLRAAALAVSLLVSLVGCDKATKPEVVKYNLYVGATHLYTSPQDSSFNRIYIYDTDSLTLLDSIYQAHFTDDMAASPDGRWLYVLDFTTQSVPRVLWKIDARSKQVVWSRSDFGGGGGMAYIRVLRNGELLLIGNTILRPEDGSVVRDLTDSLFAMWGPASGTKVAAIMRGQPLGQGVDSLIRVVDVATGEVSGYFVPRLSTGGVIRHISTVRLHPDGKRVLLEGVYGGVADAWFLVGDVTTGQTIFEYRTYRSGGEIAISSDGSLAAFTDPGTPAFGEGGIPRVIDLRTYKVTEPASGGVLTPGPGIMGSQVRFLPGDRQIVTAPASDPSLSDGGPLQVIDVTTMTLEKTIWPTGYDSLNWPRLGNLGIGPRP